MNRVRQYISGDNLIKRWNISLMDLLRLVLESKLTAYGNYGNPLLPTMKFTITETDYSVGIGGCYFLLEDIISFERSEVIKEDVPSIDIPLTRTSTKYRERCRAIAGLLWELNPKTTIASMIMKKEFLKYGCEGVEYTINTRRGWIADLCPNAKAGRPKKEDQ